MTPAIDPGRVLNYAVRCTRCGHTGGQHKGGTDAAGPEGRCPPPTGAFPSWPRTASETTARKLYDLLVKTYWAQTTTYEART